MKISLHSLFHTKTNAIRWFISLETGFLLSPFEVMNLQTFEVKIALKSDENILNKIVDKDISSFHLHLEVLRDDKNIYVGMYGTKLNSKTWILR